MYRFLALLLLAIGAAAAYTQSSAPFQFAILGDRTGETVPGVYRQVWHDVSAQHPKLIVTVGDTIQGGNDATLGGEWKSVLKEIAPYRHCPLFLTPGNHDVWSSASAAAFRHYAGHPLHYSFDYNGAHFTILDNSSSDKLSDSELDFLKKDLELHKSASPKFIFSHRPSWILQVVLANPNFPLHQIAKQYGVKYIIAGHLHQMLHFQLDGITYLSIGSAGGHLREEKNYRNGWFFGYTLVNVNGDTARFRIDELGPPYGQSRRTTVNDWGPDGLVR
jgi:predicted phosphodiesterase